MRKLIVRVAALALCARPRERQWAN